VRATTTVTRTAVSTVTAPAPVILGLYGWTAGLPDFRVGAVSATPAVGGTFGTSFTYVGQQVVGGVTCADVTYPGHALTLCPGQVAQVP